MRLRLLARLFAVARGAFGGVEIGFETSDQILEIIDLERELHGALPRSRQLCFHLGEPPLPLFDEQAHARPLFGESGKVGCAPRPFGCRLAADADEVGEIGGEYVRLVAQFREHGAQKDGGAQRLQHILRPHQQSGRRIPTNPLQRRKNLRNDLAPPFERAVDSALGIVE